MIGLGLVSRRDPRGLPAEITAGASVVLDFTTGTAVRDGEVISIDAVVSCVRPSPGVIVTPHGLRHVVPHRIRRSNRGVLIESTRTNRVRRSATPADQEIALAEGSHTLSLLGAGRAIVSGAAEGQAEPGLPLTFTLTTPGTVTVSVEGDPFHLQLEAGGFATSPIVTGDQPSTRQIDAISVVDRDWFDPGLGTLLVEWEQVAAVAGVQNLVRWDANQFHRLRTGNSVIAQIRDAGGTLVLNGGLFGTAPPPGIHRMVVGLAPDDLAVSWSTSIAGTSWVAGGSPGVPEPAPHTMTLGSNGVAEALDGWIRRIAYWPARLGNETLGALVG